MGEKEDGLRLSLSLGGGGDGGGGGGGGGENERNTAATQGFPFRLMPSSLGFMQQNQQLLPSLHLKPAFLAADSAFNSSAERNRSEPRSFLAGIDVNRPATATDGGEDEVLVSSPNSTVSSVSGKKSNEREDLDAERGSSSQEDDGGDAAANKKKLRLSKEQAAFLEETFKEHNTLNPKQKLALAKQLNLRPRQVEVWFQNRRARTKLKQTEVDCEYLKRCCENLTEENRRLQKEVNELRALKLSPQFYANMSPPTTLTMCPQCERVAVSSSSASPVPAIPAAAARPQNVQPPASKQRMGLNPWSVIFPNQPTDGHCTQS